jgi:histidine triad (HIT) family protein
MPWIVMVQMRATAARRRFAVQMQHRTATTFPLRIPMADKTLFSRIIDGEIPGSFVYQDEHVVAIRDINPAAPVHVLVVPRKPIPSLAELEEGDLEIAGRILLAVRRIAEQEGLDRGYRVVVNTGEEGGQTVPHLHFHILGGRQLSGHGTA